MPQKRSLSLRPVNIVITEEDVALAQDAWRRRMARTPYMLLLDAPEHP
jgi:hypothetical protein